MMYDLLIKNGYIIDGSGDKGYTADLGILGKNIYIAPNIETPANRIINAEGSVVAPGFIDIHSHTDHLVFVNQTSESKVAQGVTTEISGNCGESAAPRGGLHCDESMCDWGPDHGVIPDWVSMTEFLDKLEMLPKTINFATFTGHSTIRGVVMGYEDHEPTIDEIDLMRRYLIDSMEAGSFGLSSGLIYPPGCYAETDELIKLCEIMVPYNGIYASHIRNEADDVVEFVDEAINIGIQSGVSVQLSHHKACGYNAKGLVNATLKQIDDARSRGIDVWTDQYPYNATCTGLSSLLPQSVHNGGTGALMERLRSKQSRSAIIYYLSSESRIDGKIGNTGGWESIVVNQVYSSDLIGLAGKNIKEISSIFNMSCEDTVIYLLLKDQCNTGIIHFMIDEDDINTVIKHDNVLIGSDATARSKSGVLSRGKPHPRAYGTFPRVFKEFVRDKKLLNLETAISKMTGKTAKRLGIKNRGFLKTGYYADIVIFNADIISDNATYSEPAQYPSGIKYVIVNGEVVCEENYIYDIKCKHPGQILRRNI